MENCKQAPVASFKTRKTGLAGLMADQRAAVAMVFVFALIPLMMAIGVAVDSVAAYRVETRLQRSLDAAGLAAARAGLNVEPKDEALMFLETNFERDYSSAVIDHFDLQVTNDDEIIVEATYQHPNAFMQLFGMPTTELGARSVIQRQVRGMELALVMDNTGSMRAGGRMDAMKLAATNLINIVFGAEEEHNNLWVALVPYSAMVNVGSEHTDWLASTDRVHTNPSSFDPTTWKGCVMARGGGHDETDEPPSVAPFESFYYASASDNVWPGVNEANSAQNNGTGPNLGCGPTVTSLRSSKTAILAAIDEMQPWHRGGTTGNLGLAWGWRAVSPRWRGLWPAPTPAQSPVDYDNSLVDKVVILLTDGQNQFYDHGGGGPSGSDMTAYGRLHDFGYATLALGRQEIDRRMARMCEQMKGAGIELYTVTFGSTPDDDTKALYRDCATSPGNYFHSPNNEQLQTAFRSIAGRMSYLRVSR